LSVERWADDIWVVDTMPLLARTAEVDGKGAAGMCWP
jgi:hypothetical protein